MALLKWVLNQYDVFKKYNVDKYLTEYALCTRKDYQKRGIGTEFIKARTAMCKALNVPVTAAGFTVIGSQKAAVKAGHIEGYKLSYAELQKKFPTFDFSKSNAEYLKIFEFKP